MAQKEITVTKKRPLYKSLYIQVLAAVVVGISLGHFYPDIAIHMKPLGDIFIQLIKMLVAPIIFCTVVSGIAALGHVSKVGRIGMKALTYFMFMTTFALAIGLVVVNIFQPGAGLNADLSGLDTATLGPIFEYEKQGDTSLLAFVQNIVPNTIFGAFTRGDILQVLFLALLFAFALAAVGEKGKMFVDFLDSSLAVLFKILHYIMHVAPIGAFGAMAFTIGRYGVESLSSLFALILCFYLTCLLFILIVLGFVLRLCGVNIFAFLRYLKTELFIVLGTSSSESVLPRMMDKMTHLGCSRSLVGLVIPTGYSFNLDGTAIYLTMAALFIAQATNTPLGLWDQLLLLTVMIISSKGAAGITGSGFVVLASTLASTHHVPVEGIALILGIDRFMSEARAITNVIGNGVATVAVAKWEGDLDVEQMNRVLKE